MKLLIITLLSVPFFSFANTNIRITSFERADSRNFTNTTGEVCGLVTSTSASLPEKVLVISDPGKYEGHYIVNVTPQGRFCHVIRTLRGQVAVTLLNAKAPTPRVTKSLK